jgi:hypothetical protein
VVTSSDAETGVDVVEDSPESSLELERDPVGGDEAHQRNKHNKCCVEPVDVLGPVAPSHGSVGDVRLVDVLLGSAGSKRDIVLGAIREWRGILARSSSCRHIDYVADGLLELAMASVVGSNMKVPTHEHPKLMVTQKGEGKKDLFRINDILSKR